MNRAYTWRPDVPDHRDHVAAIRSTLPKKIDLRDICSTIEDQGSIGSCVSNAWAGAIELKENVGRVERFINASRLFIYYNARLIEGTVKQDAGAEIRDGAKALQQWGACDELLWPYRVKAFATKPSAKAYAEAKRRTIGVYERCTTLKAVKTALSFQQGVVLGFSVYESFESDAVAKSGIMPYPGSHERMFGGHAVLAVGYEDSSKYLICRNSWGAAWGDKGYFYMPYAVAENRNLSDDFWTLQ